MDKRFLIAAAGALVLVGIGVWFVLYQVPAKVKQEVEQTLASLPPELTSQYKDIEIRTLSNKAIIHELTILDEADNWTYKIGQTEILGAGSKTELPPVKLLNIVVKTPHGMDFASIDSAIIEGANPEVLKAFRENSEEGVANLGNLRLDKIKIDGFRMSDGAGFLVKFSELNLAELEHHVIGEISLRNLFFKESSSQMDFKVSEITAKDLPFVNTEEDGNEAFIRMVKEVKSLGGLTVKNAKISNANNGAISVKSINISPIPFDTKTYSIPVPKSLTFSFEDLEFDTEFVTQAVGSIIEVPNLDPIIASYSASAKIDPNAKTFTSKDLLNVEGLGQLESGFTIGNVPFEIMFEVPEDQEAFYEENQQVIESISLISGRLSFEDQGLVNTVLSITAAATGADQQELIEQSVMFLDQLVDGEKNPYSEQLAKSFGDFLISPGRIELKLSPDNPVIWHTLDKLDNPDDILNAVGFEVGLKPAGKPRKVVKANKSSKPLNISSSISKKPDASTSENGEWILDQFSQSLNQQLR